MSRLSKWLVAAALAAGLLAVALFVRFWFYRPEQVEYSYAENVTSGESSRVVFFHTSWLSLAIVAAIVFGAIFTWRRLRARNRRTGAKR